MFDVKPPSFNEGHLLKLKIITNSKEIGMYLNSSWSRLFEDAKITAQAAILKDIPNK